MSIKLRRLQVDLNRRTGDNLTPAKYNGPTPKVDEAVLVFEPEDAVQANGTVVRVDSDRCLAFISVDWTSIRDLDTVGPELRVLSSRAMRTPASVAATWSEGVAMSSQDYFLVVGE